MIRPIIHDPLFLAQKSQPATETDRQVITDLLDTLRANLDRCVGMAANMIGEQKRVIVVCNGPLQMVMVNPAILARSGEYEAEEGCLSLAGTRKTKRYRDCQLAIIPGEGHHYDRCPEATQAVIRQWLNWQKEG